MKDEPHLIQKRGLYYRPNAHGYTSNILEAGIFPADRARAECRIEEGISAIPVSALLPEIDGMIRQLEGLLEQWRAARDEFARMSGNGRGV